MSDPAGTPMAVRIATAVYSALISFLPGRIVHPHRREMVALFREMATTSLGSRGLRGLVAIFTMTIGDLLVRVVTERLYYSRNENSSTTGRRTKMTTTLGTLLMDLKVTARTLTRRPLLAVVAMATLAIGVGANTAVFSVLWGAWLKPLPFPEAEQLVLLSDRHESFDPGRGGSTMTPGDFWELKQASRTLDAAAAFSLTGATWGEESRRVTALLAGPEFFDILGLSMYAGRGFDETDAESGNQSVVVSFAFWRDELGGDPEAVGSEVVVAGRPWTLVGVTHPDFEFRNEPRIFVPWMLSEELRNSHDGRSIRGLARISEGVTLEAARAELQTLYADLAERYPDSHEGWTAWASPLGEYIVQGEHRVLMLMGGAAMLLLLVTCANLSSLFLTRAEGRQQEMAVRQALGAGGLSLTGTFLSETLLLGLAGGALGVVVAYGGIDLLVSIFGEDLARPAAIGLNSTTLLVALGLTLGTSLVMGLVPALRLDRIRLGDRLRSAGRTSGKNTRLRRFLVASEIVFAVVLVSGAGLLLNTLFQLSTADLGFDADDVLVVNFDLSQRLREDETLQQDFFRRLNSTLASRPEIAAIGVADRVPPDGNITTNEVAPAGRLAPQIDFVGLREVTAGYFDALGIEFTEGGDFDGWVEPAPEGVILPAVINRPLAEALFEGEAAIGREFTGEGSTFRVVGVVEAVHQDGANEPVIPMIYAPWPAVPLAFVSRPRGVLRTASGAAAATAALREVVEALDSEVRFSTSPLTERLDRLYGDQEFAVSLLGVFAFLALGLGAVGIYGTLAYTVARRTREVGVRMALGADRGAVVGLILRQGLMLTVWGIVVGLVIAVASSRFLEALLYGVSPVDPLTLSTVTGVFILTGVLACWIPARRASRIQPTEALRAE